LANTRFWAPLSLSAQEKHSIHSPAQMEAAADELPIEQVLPGLRELVVLKGLCAVPRWGV
jgi:hypothetical protein